MIAKFDEISQLLKEISELDVAINESTVLEDDLMIDSLKFIDIVVAMEQDFGVELSEDELVDVRTVGDLVKLLVKSNN